MIVRDEAAFIGDCLLSLRDHVDEIVVVDTGSVDETPSMAAELGANGVLYQAINEASSGAKVAAAIFGTGTQRKGHSLAIYVPGDSLRVRAACDGTKNRGE